MLNGTKSVSGGEKNNFEYYNWAGLVEARISRLPEKSSIREKALIQKQHDNARIELLRDQIVQLSDQEESDSEPENFEIDPVAATREQRIKDAENIFGEDSFFAHLIKNN